MFLLDSVSVPGTGPPGAGGPAYVELRAALQALARRGRRLGMHLANLSPPCECAEITARNDSKPIVDLL